MPTTEPTESSPGGARDRGNHFLSGHPHVDLFKGGSGGGRPEGGHGRGDEGQPHQPDGNTPCSHPRILTGRAGGSKAAARRRTSRSPARAASATDASLTELAARVRCTLGFGPELIPTRPSCPRPPGACNGGPPTTGRCGYSATDTLLLAQIDAPLERRLGRVLYSPDLLRADFALFLLPSIRNR